MILKFPVFEDNCENNNDLTDTSKSSLTATITLSIGQQHEDVVDICESDDSDSTIIYFT